MKKLIIITTVALLSINLQAQKLNGLTFQFNKVEYYTIGAEDSKHNYTDSLMSEKSSYSKVRFVISQRYGSKVLIYVTLDGETEEYAVDVSTIYEYQTDMYGREIEKDYSKAKLEDFYKEYLDGYDFYILGDYGKRFGGSFTLKKDKQSFRLEVEGGKLRAVYLTK